MRIREYMVVMQRGKQGEKKAEAGCIIQIRSDQISHCGKLCVVHTGRQIKNRNFL